MVTGQIWSCRKATFWQTWSLWWSWILLLWGTSTHLCHLCCHGNSPPPYLVHWRFFSDSESFPFRLLPLISRVQARPSGPNPPWDSWKWTWAEAACAACHLKCQLLGLWVFVAPKTESSHHFDWKNPNAQRLTECVFFWFPDLNIWFVQMLSWFFIPAGEVLLKRTLSLKDLPFITQELLNGTVVYRRWTLTFTV